jgi:TRAP-type C4-dicarboxylate transport system permease small subunit
MQDLDAGPKIVGDDGQFHAQDEAVDLSGTTLEAWAALGIFWLLGATVFYQFFTRYVLNDSAAWTEEIARYLLIGVVFIGACIGVSKNNHIQVDFFFKFMPNRTARWMSTLVDLLRVLFLMIFAVLTLMMMMRLNHARMTIIDLPMNLVYAFSLTGFTLMSWRAIQVARIHWQRGYSVLERPETSFEDA